MANNGVNSTAVAVGPLLLSASRWRPPRVTPGVMRTRRGQGRTLTCSYVVVTMPS